MIISNAWWNAHARPGFIKKEKNDMPNENEKPVFWESEDAPYNKYPTLPAKIAELDIKQPYKTPFFFVAGIVIGGVLGLRFKRTVVLR